MSKRQTKTPAWAVRMRKLGPGIYLQGESLHISEAELCEYFRLPYTPANVKLIEETAMQAVRQVWPEIKMEVRVYHEGDDQGGDPAWAHNL